MKAAKIYVQEFVSNADGGQYLGQGLPVQLQVVKSQ